MRYALVYSNIVSYTNACGTYSDTSVVTVTLTNAALSVQTNVNCFTGADGTATVTEEVVMRLIPTYGVMEM